MRLPTPAVVLSAAKTSGYGSWHPHVEQLRRIAETKLPDLNTTSVEAAMRIVEGIARSMGAEVSG